MRWQVLYTGLLALSNLAGSVRLIGPELLEAAQDAAFLTEKFCARVTGQLLSALHHLHAVVGIYHRDIKPENLRSLSGQGEGCVGRDLEQDQGDVRHSKCSLRIVFGGS